MMMMMMMMMMMIIIIIIIRIIGSSFAGFYGNSWGWKLRHTEQLYELPNGPDTVKYMKLKRLQWVGHIVWMERKELLDGKFRRRRPVGRPRLRWKDKIRKNFSLLLNIRGWRRLAGAGDNWRWTSGRTRHFSLFARFHLSREVWRLRSKYLYSFEGIKTAVT